MSVVRTRHGGQVEVRSAQMSWGNGVPPAWSGYGSDSGATVNTTTAAGLPAVGRAIRLVGGLIGMAMIGVYEGRAGEKRERPDTDQANLFQAPYPGVADFDWRYDIAVSLEVSENAFIRKIKTGRGKLIALQVMQPRYVNASLDRYGEKQYEISTAGGWQRVNPDEILHIRGQTVDGGPFGVSRITQHRDPLGAMVAAQRFEGSYFRNHARPDIVATFPQTITLEQGKEWEANFNAKHSGPDNAGKAIAVGGGATLTPIPINMRDAQFIEAKGMSVGDVARIMDVEEVLLGTSQAEQQDDQAMDRFLAFQLPPRLARIARALKADTDLFPVGDPLYPEFVAEPLLFASPTTRATVQHSQIQAGTLLPDEARADNGRPPLPDGLGQIPQVTPVGGAPNPDPLPNGQPVEEKALPTINVNVSQPGGSTEIRDVLVAIRDQKPPVVNNNIRVPAAPDVHVDARTTVHTPENVTHIDVQLPEQPAPIVNVETAPVTIENRAPEQPAPVVNIDVQPTPVTVEGAVHNVEVRVPEQQAPAVNVTVDPTPVTVESVVHVPEPAVNVDVHVPRQEAPVVNVETAPITVEARAAEQLAPVVNVHVDPTPVTVDAPVTVNVPEAAPPIVMVENTVEQTNKQITLERDQRGNLKGARVEDA